MMSALLSTTGNFFIKILKSTSSNNVLIRSLLPHTQKHTYFLTPESHFHCSTTLLCSNEPAKEPWRSRERVKTFKKPMNWLPFQWHRRMRFNVYEKSGDLVKTIETDPSWPKPDFESTEELEDADETVKKYFTLATSSKNERIEAYKRHLLRKVQRHPLDFTSLEAQAAIATVKVRKLFDRMRENPRYSKLKTYSMIAITKRNSILRRLRMYDHDTFDVVLRELKLEYTPQPFVLNPVRYCKKWDLRQLTKKHCERIVKEKKEALHQEFKSQQEAFLKEKEEILAWIAEEEKALGVKKETEQ